ncbi:MAG: hypothetical protein J0653_03645, partial [Deltaproteobacteria bacterium]|nr:hypothetical protein [Deltaproteobacteria bacterium]
MPEGDISYRRINEIVSSLSPGYSPGKGLNVPQMRALLSALGIKYNDVDYSQFDEQFRKDLPYQKYAYSGLESGGGALVGFCFAGAGLQEEAKH